jgi:hypothetical protein
LAGDLRSHARGRREGGVDPAHERADEVVWGWSCVGSVDT